MNSRMNQTYQYPRIADAKNLKNVGIMVFVKLYFYDVFIVALLDDYW